MRKLRSKEEKLKLIENYKASGLSMSKWCAANGIATSTLSTWLASTNNKKKKTKSTKSNKKAKFIEVPKTTMVKTLDNNKVTLEYKDFKISISDSQDILLLKDILKVVTELNV